jgi:hypothetical protein
MRGEVRYCEGTVRFVKPDGTRVGTLRPIAVVIFRPPNSAAAEKAPTQQCAVTDQNRDASPSGTAESLSSACSDDNAGPGMPAIVVAEQRYVPRRTDHEDRITTVAMTDPGEQHDPNQGKIQPKNTAEHLNDRPTGSSLTDRSATATIRPKRFECILSCGCQHHKACQKQQKCIEAPVLARPLMLADK